MSSVQWSVCLREDLAKPAATLFLHRLTGILDQAIRATNAQYDDLDILKRIDVRLLEVSRVLCSGRVPCAVLRPCAVCRLSSAVCCAQAVCNVQCVVGSVPCAVCRVPSAVCCAQAVCRVLCSGRLPCAVLRPCAMCRLLCAVLRPCAVCRVPSAVCRLPCAVCRLPHAHVPCTMRMSLLTRPTLITLPNSTPAWRCRSLSINLFR